MSSGLINLLQKVLKTSKQNINAVEKLIAILEGDNINNANVEDVYNESNIIHKDDITHGSFNFRDDNIILWDKTFEELNDLENLYPNSCESSSNNEWIYKDLPFETQDNLNETLEKKTGTDKTSELITPLSKLSKDEEDKLLYSMFQSAINNVKNIMGISESEKGYNDEVNKEADRLFQLWMDTNKLI